MANITPSKSHVLPITGTVADLITCFIQGYIQDINRLVW